MNWAAWQGGWVEAMDFAGPRVRPAWWAWCLLGVAVLALLVLAERLDHQEGARVESAAQLKRLERADRQQRLQRAAALRQADGSSGPRSGAGPGEPASAAPPLTGSAVTEAAQMARLLSYPWADVLYRMEMQAAEHQVVLMGMSLNLASSSARPLLRAQGAVQGDSAALQWASGLPQGQLLSRQALATPFEGLRGRYAMKADVQAMWSDGPAGSTP